MRTDLEGERQQDVTGNAGRSDHPAEEVAPWDLHEVMPTRDVEMVEGGRELARVEAVKDPGLSPFPLVLPRAMCSKAGWTSPPISPTS